MILISVAALLALMLTLIMGVPYLEFLKNRLYGQYILEDAPERHAQKAGTPTTGGMMIVFPTIIAAGLALILDVKQNIPTLLVLLTFVLLCLIGFRDDLYKITKKKNKGLTARIKLVLQIAISAIPAIYMYMKGATVVSVFDLFNINLGILYPVFAVLVVVGSSNAVNLTDGLDGLAAGSSAIAAFFTTVFCIIIGRNDLAIIAAALGGSCIGFLYYNKYPAKVFMGDTGSLALGGIFGAIAVVGKFELWLLILGLLFVIETLSVIIQVTSFKLTGKRVFKMSPIHHHFELLGWSETKIVKTFWAVSFIAGAAACAVKYFLIH